MIDVREALALVLQQTQPLAAHRTPLNQALGGVLAEDVTSDVDSPPHDKALMDGYAVRAEEIHEGRELTVVEQVTAGDVPQIALGPGQCARIMTGAPIPAGADAVVMLERVEEFSHELGEAGSPMEQIRVGEVCVLPGANVMPRGTSLRRGEVVLPAGRSLTAAAIGLLAEVGCVKPLIAPRPSVAVLATGNELVDGDGLPPAGHIRNSNGPMLAALAEAAGGRVVSLGIARDTPADLQRLIAAGLRHDVLLLSGGVSAGVLDLVPQTLAELGVRRVFHKLRLKPGKPLWFGVLDGPPRCLVFGLPGNPVSGFVCFELFVRPALAALRGAVGTPWRRRQAALSHRFEHRGDRPTFFPARLTHEENRALVQPLDWHGSADLRTVVEADVLICFPGEPRCYEAGELVEIHPLSQ